MRFISFCFAFIYTVSAYSQMQGTESLINRQIYSGSFVVAGSANSYYPVVFKNGNQDKINHIKIYRSYSEAGPNELSPTHKGGLTLEIDANYGGWGGSTYDWRIMDLRQTYHETFAGATHAMHNMGFIVWLRGGGFLYHYESDYAANLQIALNGELIYDDANPAYDAYAPAPKSSPDIANIDGHRNSFWVAQGNNLSYNGGNVGIGTSNPIYKLSVKGVIGAGEVKIDNISTWADFVFKPSYKLRSLSDLEHFIKKNSHLPDVLSEAEVKKNGIGLGAMNATLLQKIEELTLYIIAQNNKIEQNQNTIENQSMQIIELEKQNQLIKEIEVKLKAIKNGSDH